MSDAESRAAASAKKAATALLPERRRFTMQQLREIVELVGEEFTDEELREMMEEADRDGDGDVKEDDFVRVMKKTGIWAT
ncbi:Cellulase/esterase CelE [Irineochytrium annulatum]|nr:Cellulase/esterase CelE [Irineochytrium annulatum]